MSAVDPDGEGARDEDDRQRETERRDKQQRLDAQHRLDAAADRRRPTPRCRRHYRPLTGARRPTARRQRASLMPGADERQEIRLAEETDESGRAATLEAARPVDARPVVTTRRRDALVDALGAVSAGKPRRACAPEVVNQLRADAAVGARSGETLVDVLLAEGADEAGRAAALEVVGPVDAESAVEARVDGTLVAVDLASVAAETRRADASETAAHVQTRPAFGTPQRNTLENIRSFVLNTEQLLFSADR